MFLGVDGGGTKTAYAVIDASGRVHAQHIGSAVEITGAGHGRAGP